MSNVTVIGDGGWGTALAMVLHRNGHAVRVWGPFPDYIDRVQRTRENQKFLPGVNIPTEILFTADRKTAMRETDRVILAVPSRYFREVLQTFAGLIPDSARILSVTKGLDKETHQRMSEIAGEICRRARERHVLTDAATPEELRPRPDSRSRARERVAISHPPPDQVLTDAATPVSCVAALSGPSHAEEVARGIPTAVTVACSDHAVACEWQDLFSNEAFRVYTSDDMVGVELGGALKNVIAIAAGVSDGIGFGNNTKAALVTRGLAELARLGTALGAHPATFAGLSGVGDLVVTCTSRLSRNRAVGERLGRGEKIESILKSMEQVAEGVWTCGLARDLAKAKAVEVPITEEVCALVYEGKDPRAAVRSLLGRDPRRERD